MSRGMKQRPQAHGEPREGVDAALLAVDDADRVRTLETGLAHGATASAAAPPHVTTSSTRQTRSPGENAPSMRFAVPYSFASPRTIKNGIPEASDVAAASGTAPSSGAASRIASGSARATVSASRAPISRSSSGSVAKRYLSR